MPRTKSKPVWRGPEVDGITASLLAEFLTCRERFRLLVTEGLQPRPHFSHRLEYGHMWHVCEEEFARTKGQHDNWQRALLQYAKGLCAEYKECQEQIQHWYNVCRIEFPAYVEYWAKHPGTKHRTSIFREKVFDVPYVLPSGRHVRLRGKWDGVDLLGKGRQSSLYLWENKTKGDIVEQQLKRQLQFDLQTMLYLIALRQSMKDSPEDWAELNRPLAGVIYNVVRRPLSGGKNSIRQTQKETPEQFYARLGNLIRQEAREALKTKRDCFYFMRWKVEVTSGDIERFRRECLDPVLEQLCDWWDVVGEDDPWSDVAKHCHYRSPFFYNPLLEDASTPLDEHLATGSELGLVREHNLFKELQ